MTHKIFSICGVISQAGVSVALSLIVLSACSLGAPEAPLVLTQPATMTATPPAPSPTLPTLTATVTLMLPSPTATMPPTSIPPVNSPVPASLSARIVAGIGHTYLHDTPGLAGKVLVRVNEFAPLRLVGRSDDGTWLETTLEDGTRGWLLAREMNITGDVLTLPATGTAGGIPEAYVGLDSQGLRLRQSPGLDAPVQANLNALDALRLLGRTSDGSWLEVQTGANQTGWVVAEYVEARITTDDLPVTGQMIVRPPATALPVAASTSVPNSAPPAFNPGTYPYVSGITDTTRQIYQRGLSLGNRSNVFSKVGDSITVATWVMYPIGWGQTQYGNYTGLQPVAGYFSAANARNGNSFANISLAADNGWTTTILLDPTRGNPEFCPSGESPLLCEYRIVKPAIALIMIGTNDVSQMGAEVYRANLQQIITLSTERGIIPVLTTLPNRYGYDAQIITFNQILREISQGYGIPLVDYAAALQTAPDAGLSWDGVHPSFPPTEGDWAAAANFRDNLHYGYTLRNLTTLYALDAVWREVIQR